MKNFDDIFSRVDPEDLPIPEHPSVSRRKIKRGISQLQSTSRDCKKMLNSIRQSIEKNV